MVRLLPSNTFIIALLSFLAQWLEHSVYNRGVIELYNRGFIELYNRGVASSCLTTGILTEISLLVPGVPMSSRTTVLLR